MFKKIAIIFSFSFSLLLSPSSAASPDAIAIRIIPNPEHYSPLRWYINQGFKGSPQALTVDGYEAIRDGRTVYINSANVSLDNTKVYTNIYLISYNQEAEAATTDIFSRLLAHWKFNANIASFSGKCSKSAETDCLSNSECLSKGYCTSAKANIIRDTKRLSDLVEVKIALEEYKKKTGHYPILSAGSYLPNKTVSTWPSWTETLGKELGGNLPIDPINEMGACVGFDTITCWNETTKRFNDPDLNDGKFQLPDNSKAFIYSTDANGLSYGICSVMESGLISVDNGGGCVGSATNVGFNPVLKNNPPQVSCGLTMAFSNTNNFKSYINAYDPENKPMTTIISPISPDNWDNWAGWEWQQNPPAGLAVKNSIIPAQKEIYAKKSGNKGSYVFKAKATDGEGLSAEANCSISLDDKLFCGNGIKTGNEECDDGNNVDGDGCNTFSSHCKYTCGDKTKSGAEDCDDGNNINNDACSNECKFTCRSANNLAFTVGAANGLVYDDDSETDHAELKPNGTYLKLETSMPTPYIWVANSDFDGCVQGDNCGMVSKIRTFDGKKRDCVRIDGQVNCAWVDGTWETRGQYIGSYNVGTNPSRTAVNVETGDVWIANRGSNNVTKLDINGNHLKTCVTGIAGVVHDSETGGGPRGLAIEENGDVWVANYNDVNAVKLSGDDSDCGIKKTVILGGAPYGLAVDGENNIWVSNRGISSAQKINTVTFNVVNYSLPAGSLYGITVDRFGNIWAGRWDNVDADLHPGLFKLPYNGAAFNLVNDSGANAYAITGVTADINGDIWGSAYFAGRIIKINQAGVVVYDKESGGANPHGICGDSYGQVWSINRSSSNARVYDNNGNLVSLHSAEVNNNNNLDTYPIRDKVVVPYTYSDMTGLNRAMLLRSGDWQNNTSDVFDSSFVNQHWGSIEYKKTIPSNKQSIEVSLRASNNSDFAGVNFISETEWNSLDYKNSQRMGRYLQIKVILKSRQQGVTPVLWDLKISCQ